MIIGLQTKKNQVILRAMLTYFISFNYFNFFHILNEKKLHCLNILKHHLKTQLVLLLKGKKMKTIYYNFKTKH